jgi:hypothetical protein
MTNPYSGTMATMTNPGQPTVGADAAVRVLFLTLLTMIAFAANSILCRLALKTTPIDPATFTLIRLVAGAATLWLIVRVRTGANVHAGSWASAFSLFAYAAAFSFAYLSLSAGTGALILFGSVQATMILYGLLRGERFTPLQALGLLLALGGLAALLLPGVTAPDWPATSCGPRHLARSSASPHSDCSPGTRMARGSRCCRAPSPLGSAMPSGTRCCPRCAQPRRRPCS